HPPCSLRTRMANAVRPRSVTDVAGTVTRPSPTHEVFRPSPKDTDARATTCYRPAAEGGGSPARRVAPSVVRLWWPRLRFWVLVISPAPRSPAACSLADDADTPARRA